MSTSRSLSSPDNVKKLAKKLTKTVKNNDISHAEALELISKELGYKDWHSYLKECGTQKQEKLHGRPMQDIPIDVKIHCGPFCGLNESINYQESEGLEERFTISVDSDGGYRLKDNSPQVISWITQYSRYVDFEIYINRLPLKDGFFDFDCLDIEFTTEDMDAAKLFAKSFFEFLNTISQL